MEKNKDVMLSFGLIAFGPLREIEKLQKLVSSDCAGLKIIYQTVSAKKLFLVKKKEVREYEREKKSERKVDGD